MKAVASALLLTGALFGIAAAPAVDLTVETKARVKNMQDDLRKVEKLTMDVVESSREVENAADRIKGPNDVNDIRIVETKMDALKRDTREAKAAAARVADLARNLHKTTKELAEVKEGKVDHQAKPNRGKNR